VEAGSTMTTVSYRRSGGPDPQTDESVEISDSGEAVSRRVVSIGCAGTFAASLDAAELKTFAREAAAVADAVVELDVPSRPPYEIEEIETAATTHSFHPEQKLPRPVTTLRNRLRKLYEQLAQSPVAAVALEIDESGPTVTIRTVGDGPCEVDWTNPAATYDLYDSRQAFVGSGRVDFGLTGGRQAVPAGWKKDVPLGGIEFSPDKTLQVRIEFSMKFGDGRWRDCQVTATAGKGWG
jgi:hypothetical protein